MVKGETHFETMHEREKQTNVQRQLNCLSTALSAIGVFLSLDLVCGTVCPQTYD